VVGEGASRRDLRRGLRRGLRWGLESDAPIYLSAVENVGTSPSLGGQGREVNGPCTVEKWVLRRVEASFLGWWKFEL